MTKSEIMLKYGILWMDIPEFTGYKYCKFNHSHMKDLDWNEIFKVILNKKLGGNAKEVIYSEFKKSMYYICI